MNTVSSQLVRFNAQTKTTSSAKAPQFSGWREGDGGDTLDKQSAGSKPKKWVKPVAGVLGAMAVLVPVGKGFSWAFLNKTVPQNTFCVPYNKNTGAGDALEQGRHWKGGFMNKWTCFTSTPTRVTSSVSNISSVDKIPVTINVSVDWAPNPQAGSSNLFLYGGGTSGEPNPTLQADLAQIADVENKALWENGMYSELRSMIAELGGLVPASQVNTPAFQAVVHDAIMNGYVPKDIYDKFKDAIIVQGEGRNNLVVVVDTTKRPSLQERIDERIGNFIENTGKTPSGDSVIVINDADSRDNKIDDTAYAQALKDLGAIPLQQRAAQEQAKLKEDQREVELAQAETANQVALANTNAANERARLDAEAKKVRTLIEAAAQAESKQTVGAAENAVKEQLAKILADNPGLVQVLTAEELAKVNILVLGDGSGLNLNVPTTGG